MAENVREDLSRAIEVGSQAYDVFKNCNDTRNQAKGLVTAAMLKLHNEINNIVIEQKKDV